MRTAEYICTGAFGSAEQEEFGHYALHMPFYTHFTSPIRRYPDVLVHRLLQAALDKDHGMTGPELTATLQINWDHQNEICKHCNQKKMFAKQAQDASDKLYMCIMIRERPAEVRDLLWHHNCPSRLHLYLVYI